MFHPFLPCAVFPKLRMLFSLQRGRGKEKYKSSTCLFLSHRVAMAQETWVAGNWVQKNGVLTVKLSKVRICAQNLSTNILVEHVAQGHRGTSILVFSGDSDGQGSGGWELRLPHVLSIQEGDGADGWASYRVLWRNCSIASKKQSKVDPEKPNSPTPVLKHLLLAVFSDKMLK